MPNKNLAIFSIAALLAIAIGIALPVKPVEAQFSPRQTLTAAALNAALAAPTITAGTINGAQIGGTAPSTGAFTTLSATGASVTLTPSGPIAVNPGSPGTMENVAIGTSTPLAGKFTTLVVNGVSVGVLAGTTSSIGGSSLSAGSCSSGTVAISSSTTSMVVQATPQTYPGDAVAWKGYVSTPGTVTVKVCSIITATPTASAYNVRVIQ